MFETLRSLLAIVITYCILSVVPVHGQSYTYTFESPAFTANETLPILNRAPNLGGNDFTTSFTSSPLSNGFSIINVITAPLTGLSLADNNPADTLILNFSRSVISLSFSAATGSIANQPQGRINIDWGTSSQNFLTNTQLPNNFQVGFPSITFPSPVSSVQVSAFNGSNAQVQLFVDNLVINAVAVPEPATLLLCSAVLTGAWWTIRRRQRANQLEKEMEVEKTSV